MLARQALSTHGKNLGGKFLLSASQGRSPFSKGPNDNIRRVQWYTGGFENVCEDENGVTKPYVLHAEANAITKVARIGNSSEGSTLYITASPCLECSKLIIQAGIKRVVYNDLYRIQDGLEILRRAGVECTHIAEID